MVYYCSHALFITQITLSGGGFRLSMILEFLLRVSRLPRNSEIQRKVIAVSELAIDLRRGFLFGFLKRCYLSVIGPGGSLPPSRPGGGSPSHPPTSPLRHRIGCFPRYWLMPSDELNILKVHVCLSRYRLIQLSLKDRRFIYVFRTLTSF